MRPWLSCRSAITPFGDRLSRQAQVLADLAGSCRGAHQPDPLSAELPRVTLLSFRIRWQRIQQTAAPLLPVLLGTGSRRVEVAGLKVA